MNGFSQNIFAIPALSAIHFYAIGYNHSGLTSTPLNWTAGGWALPEPAIIPGIGLGPRVTVVVPFTSENVQTTAWEPRLSSTNRDVISRVLGSFHE
ncbi:MAG: hypothetical protein GYA41_03285 [Bacteroidales bacterium]|nr:hypothetical protein [Bacteroidales bacterium]